MRRFWRDIKGQSLIEVLIGLAIGAVLIGAASLGVTFMLRSSAASQNVQIGTGLAQDLVDKARSVSAAKWQDIYHLTKGTSTSYFVNAFGTQLVVVEGQEGVISNENTNGLVGYWKFDEATSTATTTTFDASGKSNHGTLTSGVSRATSTCKVSYCLDFDGVDDYVDSGSGSSLDITQNVTLVSWVKLDTYTSGGTNTDRASIVQKTGQYYMTVNSANGTLDAFFGGVTGSHTPSNSTVSLNQWMHTAITYDGANIKWYIDGVLDKTSAATGTITSDPRSVRIGGEPAFGRFLNGSIDEVRVYNRALSADEIQRLWNSTVFTRYFTIENVMRDSNGDITAAGGNDDPSTQKITSYVEWPGAGTATGQVSIIDYVTRWANRILNQSDWSGGSGESGVLTDPSNRYYDATSVSNPAGSIRIEGL